MNRLRHFLACSITLLSLLGFTEEVFSRERTPAVGDSRVQVRLLTTVADPKHPCRIAKDPRNNTLFYLTLGGSIYRLNLLPGDNQSTSTLVADSRDHGETNTMGFAIDHSGTFYVVGNHVSTESNAFTFAKILRGSFDAASGTRLWSTVAFTENYARGRAGFDHLFNGVEVSPDDQSLYLNSGSRTDHGEIASAGGTFPNLREDPLTALILRIPANSTNLFLPRDLAALKLSGRVFCEGLRNNYDLRFSPSGDLFGADNGPDRNMSDELNWLREGKHYGFPWRMGGEDNPQQFADYDPLQDKLLDPRFGAVKTGQYHNDPTFPKAPISMTEPVLNRGPDADKFRDPLDGQVKDASDLRAPLSTFTAHRSPLGIVFDDRRVMAAPFTGDAFVLSYMAGDESGDSAVGPFFDASNDLLHLQLTRVGNNYEARVYKLATGFKNPVDSEVIDNHIYVLCIGGEYSVWEITLPLASAVELSAPSWTRAGYGLVLNAGSPGIYSLQTSSNLLDWTTLWELSIPSGSSFFLDGSATLAPGSRFYRTSKP